MTMTRDKIEELKRLYAAMTNCEMYGEDGAAKGVMVPQSLLDQFERALAERALEPHKPLSPAMCALIESGQVEDGDADLVEPQGQALPVAWRFREYDAQEDKHSSVWLITQVRADMEVYKRYGAIIEPLYASQLALPAGPVPENVRHALNEWADAATSALQWLRNVADGTTTDHQAAIENTLSGIQHAQKVTADALASQSPAGPVPEDHMRNFENFEKLTRALEIIAVGDSKQPAQTAASVLVDIGFWERCFG